MRYPVIWTDDLPENVGGRMRLAFLFIPTISIRPKYKDDEGIYRHELEHVKQALRLLVVGHVLLKKLSRKYRIWVEASAYAVQCRYPDRHGNLLDLDTAAYRLANDYGFGLAQDEARRLIEEQ